MSFWTHCAGIIRHDWIPDIEFNMKLSEPEKQAEELKERIRIIEKFNDKTRVICFACQAAIF